MVNVKAVLATAAALAALLAHSNASGQVIQGEALAQAREFAGRALRNYVTAAVTEKNAGRLGFKTAAEAQAASLGDPISVALIGLNDLKAFERGTKVGSMLRDARTLWFPVLLNGEVRSKLEISEVNGQWLAGEFGRPELARTVNGVREGLPKILEVVKARSSGPPMLVRIPVLHVDLFYETGPEGGFLVPAGAGGLPDGVEVGKAYPAEELLARFAGLAQGLSAKTID